LKFLEGSEPGVPPLLPIHNRWESSLAPRLRGVLRN